MLTGLLERIPLTVVVIVLGLCALYVQTAMYCFPAVRREFLINRRGQTTRRIVARPKNGSTRSSRASSRPAGRICRCGVAPKPPTWIKLLLTHAPSCIRAHAFRASSALRPRLPAACLSDLPTAVHP
jgi:hypothetical protein